MDKAVKKDVVLLMAAGAVFIAANMMVVVGMKNGLVAPVENILLWGSFAVLSICSLLWAVSMLGLQPIVVAVSYVAGGIVAYLSVRVVPGMNVAEISTAGATYSAFGALMIGNATAKVRLAFFAKRQVPFIAIILVLLLVDGLLNSRVSNAGWQVISKAVLIPFLVCGVGTGLVWRLVSQGGVGRVKTQKSAEPMVEQLPQRDELDDEDETIDELLFSVPDEVDEVTTLASETVVAVDSPEKIEASSEGEATDPPTTEEEPERESVLSDSFFPLDIDEGEDHRLAENPDLMGVAAQVAQSAPVPESVEKTEIVAAIYEASSQMDEMEPEHSESPSEPEIEDGSIMIGRMGSESDVSAAVEPPIDEVPTEQPETIASPEKQDGNGDAEEVTSSREETSDVEKKETGSSDWLDSHLDLLKKLK